MGPGPPAVTLTQPPTGAEHHLCSPAILWLLRRARHRFSWEPAAEWFPSPGFALFLSFFFLPPPPRSGDTSAFCQRSSAHPVPVGRYGRSAPRCAQRRTRTERTAVVTRWRLQGRTAALGAAGTERILQSHTDIPKEQRCKTTGAGLPPFKPKRPKLLENKIDLNISPRSVRCQPCSRGRVRQNQLLHFGSARCGRRSPPTAHGEAALLGLRTEPLSTSGQQRGKEGVKKSQKVISSEKLFREESWKSSRRDPLRRNGAGGEGGKEE